MSYDVEKLISITCDYLVKEMEYMKYARDVKKENGVHPDGTLWIPALDGSSAYRLGELCERSCSSGSIMSDICVMLNINCDRLIAAVKSMLRWERRQWRWNANACLVGSGLGNEDKKRLMRFLSNGKGVK